MDEDLVAICSGVLCYNIAMCRFSIIIPCYNAIEYVDRALTSAVNQSFPRDNYEIIAVNDASTDDTLTKLEKWQEEYPNLMRVISYEVNLRQGGARNVAMKAAKGEYICFLDADDRLDEDALANYDVLINTTGADMVVTKHVDESSLENAYEKISEIGDPKECDGNGANLCRMCRKTYPRILSVFRQDENFEDILTADFGYVCCACYRRSIIIENEIWFPEHLAYEDILWPRIYRLCAKSICVSDAITYHRYDNPVSTMNKKNASHHVDRLTVYEMLLEEYKHRGIITKEYDVILNETIETYYFNSYYMFFTRMEEIPDVYGRIRKTIDQYFPGWQDVYDDSELPMIFQYMTKLLRKAANVSPKDLIPFKEAMLELVETP